MQVERYVLFALDKREKSISRSRASSSPKAIHSQSESHPAFLSVGTAEPRTVGLVGKMLALRGTVSGGLRIFASDGDVVSAFTDTGVDGLLCA